MNKRRRRYQRLRRKKRRAYSRRKIQKSASRKRRRRIDPLLQKAYRLGEIAATEMYLQHPLNKEQIVDMNLRWNHWLELNHYKNRISWPRYVQINHRFFQGVRDKAQLPSLNHLLMPTTQSVAAIVTAMNEENTIAQVMDQLQRFPMQEMIIVINGSHDQTFARVRQISNATIIHYPQPLGHDIGRVLGAKLAQSDILLFLDGDIPIQAESLLPFIGAIERGVDIALNDVSPYLKSFAERDAVSVMKELLNRSLGRNDLEANSITAIPHALSRKAIETIGVTHLSVPPKAQALAILNGLTMVAPVGVDVLSRNRVRATNIGPQNPVSELIIGDHLEALALAFSEHGERLSFQDNFRNRDLARGAQS